MDYYMKYVMFVLPTAALCALAGYYFVDYEFPEAPRWLRWFARILIYAACIWRITGRPDCPPIAFLPLFVTIVLGPIAEEICFRYMLFRAVAEIVARRSERLAYPVALVVQALYFGLMHRDWLGAFMIGLLLGSLYYVTGDIRDCILAHSLWNLSCVLARFI